MVQAYTANSDDDSGLPRINFCPLYFGLDNLDAAMKFGNDKEKGVEHWADMTNYICNKGRAWFHEILHIDFATNARQYGSNSHIDDVRMLYHNEGDDGIIRRQIYVAYGPKMTKALARWKSPTEYTIINADSLTMYAHAKYIQKAVGNIYPHLPLGAAPPRNIIDDFGQWSAGDLFTVYANGTGKLGSSPEVSEYVVDEKCPQEFDGLEAEQDKYQLKLHATGFAPASVYPEEYLAQYAEWAKAAALGPLGKAGVAPGKAVKPGTELRILPVGDSITVGFLSERDGGDGNGYRLKLLNNLSRTESTGTMSDGYFAAWSGQTIKYITDHIEPSLDQQPNIVLVHAGTNDMNPNLQIAKEGNDPAGAAQRLGDLIDRVMDKCPDATVLVAMIISTCNEAQQVNTARYQALIPDIGYRDFADYWYDFITQIPTDWIEAPNGDGPNRPTHPGPGANGGLDSGISPPDWGSNPIQVGSKAGVREAANKASNGGLREEVGRVADGLGRDPDHVRLHDMNGDGKADYVWLDPQTGEIRCWINNLPEPWSPAGNNDSIIGSGAGAAASIFLADMNGDGLDDYMVVNPANGAVRIWWNYGPDDGWVNGWKFVEGGQIASGVPHANWATLHFPDINGDGRAVYVYAGSGGPLRHWMNTGSPGGQNVLFLDQGGIATGATSDISKLVLADMDGDGRDDYLIWDKEAGLTGFLNQPTWKEGVPVFVDQGPPKTIADGITQSPSTIRLADMDGDGMDDYAHIGDKGAIRLWYNRGTVDSSMAIDGLRFADIDGDGVSSYVPANALNLTHEDVTCSSMTMFGLIQAAEPRLYTSIEVQTMLMFLVGNGPLSMMENQSHRGLLQRTGSNLATLMGNDGKDDYLVLDAKTGELTVYFNEGPDRSRPEEWRWNPIGSIAKGLGPGRHVRFADIDGDGFDDYIFLHSNGATTIYRNVWATDRPPNSWKAMPDADASGIGQRPEEIAFHDINGDGKADYIWTRPRDGAAKVWLNNYPNQPTWLEQPEIAGGVGASGASIRYAVLQNTGRASYVAVDRSDGAISAWLNGCKEHGPVQRPNLVLIVRFEYYGQGRWNRNWNIFENTAGKTVDFCDTSPKKSQKIGPHKWPVDTPEFPTKIEGFEVHGIKGCSYEGSKDAPGRLTCPGANGIRCSKGDEQDEIQTYVH
ncbi:hypothetical protein CKAH01_06581 [Colletotrichum kahawae]|uniref:SGNH hydrolase-type esterase domain-containing protein n=1 Tax=Colletotrichum kahawae TaxID=34407 RepID=A0AAE0D3I4_COLKA|nr:hypothetical protein CKAH01_06581 [Colletotrichum kahawae]